MRKFCEETFFKPPPAETVHQHGLVVEQQQGRGHLRSEPGKLWEVADWVGQYLSNIPIKQVDNS